MEKSKRAKTRLNTRPGTTRRSPQAAIPIQLQIAALESAANGIVITDRSGAIVWVNRAFTQLTGYTREEAIGQNPRILKSGQQDSTFYKELWSQILAGQVWRGEMLNRRKDGTTYHEEMSITPVLETGKEITHFIAVKQDVTRRKLAEQTLQESEKRYRTLFTNMTEGFALGEAIYADDGSPADFRFLEMNDAFEQQTGLKRADVLGRLITEALPKLERSWIETYCSVASTGRSVRFESYNADTRRDYDVFCYCPVPGQFAILFRDISDEKQAARQVEKLNLDLRTQAANLASANQELEAFSYSVSHDLRTPLNGIETFARILLDEHAAQLDPNGQTYLQLVYENARHATELILGLYAFSRYSRQPLNKQRVETSKLVERAIQTLCPERQTQPDEISIGELAPCEGDPVLLEQVWVNLIGNAIKYTQKQSKPRIQIGCEADRETGEPIYHVRDNGAGFDMENAEHLFSVFQRLHDSEEYEGTGIGLAIVQRIVHRHGGRIWAQAAVDQGATFYFTLGRGG